MHPAFLRKTLRAWIGVAGGALGAVVLLSVEARADAGAPGTDGGADAATRIDAGGASCASPDDCAVPTPYCDVTRHACVECLSDRNCDSTTGLCDTARGACVPCFSDLDCTTPNPYCSDTLDRCVECRTDSNCPDEGVQCLDGVCGSCGDGICGSRERTMVELWQPVAPSPNGEPVLCPEDCSAYCGEVDLGSAIGSNLATVTAQKNRFALGCGGYGGPDVSFKWTAPATGTFFFGAQGSSQSTSFYVLAGGECSFLMGYSCTSDGEQYPIPYDVTAGDEVVIVLDTDAAGDATYVLGINDTCGNCGSVPDAGGTVDSGGGIDDQTASCLANASFRGDPMCDGVQCACEHCPQAYDDCAVVPGCDAVRDCMEQKNCIGADCYNSGACRGAIDTYGGVSAPAFRAAATLQSCSLSYGCAVPCATDGGATASSDAGRLCAPNRTVACTCDGGASGEQVCVADGQSFGPCSCEGSSKKGEDDGCGCRIAHREGGASGIGLAALLALDGLRRVRRARRATREKSS